MKKAIWLLLLALLLACGPANSESLPAVTGTEEDTAVTDTDEATNTEETIESPESTTMAATNLDDFSPVGTVAEAAVVREQDWRKGAADPAVVIIEYGDFQ